MKFLALNFSSVLRSLFRIPDKENAETNLDVSITSWISSHNNNKVSINIISQQCKMFYEINYKFNS